MDLTKLLELITGGGPTVLAAVFAYLWHLERSRNEALSLKIEALLERCINAINAGAMSVGDLRVFLGLQREEK